MAKISAFIIAKNEETRIAKAIESVKNIVEELYVIDSGSIDRTVEIAGQLGAKVIYNPWPGYVKQKAFGESLCKNDWILNIDADEELSLRLQNEIKAIFAAGNQDQYLAYQIKLVIMMPLDIKPRFLAPYNKCIRLYHRGSASFANNKDSTTHDSVLFNKDVDFAGKIYQLKASALHRSATSIEQLIAKANFYTTQQAQDLINTSRLPSKLRTSLELFFWIFKAFFLRRYFVFGFDGFVYSIIFAFARFTRLAKAREKAHPRVGICHPRGGGDPEL